MNNTDKNEPRRIILARHGQTEWNKEYRFQGRTNVQLTEEGKLQAQALAARLALWSPEVVYTSPLDRALYTAQTIAEKNNLSPVILNELEEVNFGTWEGQSINGLEKNQHEIFARWRADPFFNPPPGAESWEKLYARLAKAVKFFLDGAYKRIVVVSHGGIIRALYAVFLGLNPHKIWNIDVSNCSMTGVEFRNGRPCLSFANDNMHVRAGTFGQSLPLWGDTYEPRS